MSAKKKRHKLIEDIVLERGALCIGAFGGFWMFRRKRQRDVDKLCEGGLLKGGMAALSYRRGSQTPHLIKDFRPIWPKSVILARRQQADPDGATVFISIGSTC